MHILRKNKAKKTSLPKVLNVQSWKKSFSLSTAMNTNVVKVQLDHVLAHAHLAVNAVIRL
ncbi:hypothetical protein D3C75_1291680 [compost metagenome]